MTMVKSKLNLEGLKKIKYRYHDVNGDKHDVCECELYETLKMGTGSSKSSLTPKPSILNSLTPNDYKAMNVYAYKSYTLSNNYVFTKGKVVAGYTQLYYKASSEKIKMV